MQQIAKPLRVLMLAPDSRVMGGITTFVHMLKKYLEQCEVETVAIGSLNGTAGGDSDPETLFRRVLRLIVTPVIIVRKAKHHDIVHINTPFNARGLIRDGLIVLALRAVGYRRTLLYFHGWDSRTYRRIRVSCWLRKSVAWLLNGTARILVLAPEFKNDLMAIGVQSERIMLTRTMFDSAECGAKSEMATEVPVILFLSRIIRQKGVYELLNAFADVAEEFASACLVFAGDGDELSALRAYAATRHLSHRVTFSGFVQGAEKWRLLKGCTLFALPTFYPEGMPIAVIEAMAAGKPLLATNAGGMKSIISAPSNGVILEEAGTESVAAGLRTLLGDPALMQQCGEHNRAYAWSTFDAVDVVAEIREIYSAIGTLHV